MKPAKLSFPARLWNRSEPVVFFAGAAFIIAACLAAYFPALNAGFIWDDDVSLYNNRLIGSSQGLNYIWFSTRPRDYFPLAYSSFWLEWRLWAGNPVGYHVINVLLHGVGAVLFWRVLRGMKVPGAWWAGLFFTLHPVCVASVAWISERKNILSLVFCLLSVLCYLRFVERRQKSFFAASLGAFLLALSSKSSVVMLPIILVGWHWWQHQRQQQNSISWTKVALPLAPFFGASLIFGAATVWFQTHRAIGVDSASLDPVLKRVLAGGWATWFYLGKLLWPANLSMVYPRLELNPQAWWSYVPIPAWLVLFGVGYHYRKTWGKHLCFVEICFLANLLPVLGFFPMYYFKYSQMADHWQYLAMLAVIACFTGILFQTGKSLSPLQGVLTPARSVGAMLAIVLGTLTWRQASVYRSSKTLWEDVIRKNPNAWVAYNNLGAQLSDPRAAEAYYKKALSLNPKSELTLNNLGVCAVSQGRLGEAVEFFERALGLEPRYGEAHSNLGSILVRLNKVNEALPHLEKGLRLCPYSAAAYSNLADARCRLGQWGDALQLYQTALQLKPGMPEALYGLGSVLLRNSRLNEAVPYLDAAAKAAPDFAAPRVALGAAALELGKTNEAIRWFESVLRTDPANPDAHYNLGVAYEQSGHPEKAQPHYEKAREYGVPAGPKP